MTESDGCLRFYLLFCQFVYTWNDEGRTPHNFHHKIAWLMACPTQNYDFIYIKTNEQIEISSVTRCCYCIASISIDMFVSVEFCSIVCICTFDACGLQIEWNNPKMRGKNGCIMRAKRFNKRKVNKSLSVLLSFSSSIPLGYCSLARSEKKRIF